MSTSHIHLWKKTFGRGILEKTAINFENVSPWKNTPRAEGLGCKFFATEVRKVN